jgi:hypothetical protein
MNNDHENRTVEDLPGPKRGFRDFNATEVNLSPYATPEPTKRILCLNRKAIKEYALKVAKAKRACKFSRVSDTFLAAVEAEFEAKVITLAGTHEKVPAGEFKFVTSHGKKRAAERLEELAQNIVYGKVMRHPSIGVTLKD